jgi:hypothetical protein
LPRALDDDHWKNGAKIAATPPAPHPPYDASAVGFQNSERFLFFNVSPILLGYKPTDKVLVTLSAANTTRAGADPSVTIGFDTPAPVPEPSAIVFTLTVVGFLGFNRLRRRRQQA